MAKAKDAWRNRIVGTGEEAPDQLMANPRNWRRHPALQRDALRGSLDSVGWVATVMVNRTTGNVVDGHARIEEALSRDEPTVPVSYVELTEEEEALVLATLDPIAAMAERDDEALAALLTEIGDHDAGLDALLAGLAPLKPTVGRTEPDDVPDVPDDSGIVAGDLFALGDHRLLCGDSTKADAYERLLGSLPVNLVWTDPPWNVDIGKDANPRHRKRKGLVNDNISDVDFEAFLAAWAQIVVPRLTGDMYCVLGASEWPRLDRVLRDAGMHWGATVIWVKDNFVLGRGNYHRRYEPLWYGWPKAVTSSFLGDRTLDDVWEIPRPRRSDEHPTMKPVALVERSIAASSLPGAVVLDPFAGSGTTIIAAERLHRRCYAIEIDPPFVAVCIKRWEDHTGRKATKL